MSQLENLNVFNVNERKDKDPFWNKMGKAFAFKTEDGREGYRIPSLNLVLLPEKEGDEAGEGEADEDVDVSQRIVGRGHPCDRLVVAHRETVVGDRENQVRVRPVSGQRCVEPVLRGAQVHSLDLETA